MSKKKIIVLAIVALFVLPLLAACGGANDLKVTEGTPDNTYVMELSKDSAKSGEVTFHITNNAQSETHEFVIVKTDLQASELPTQQTSEGTEVVESEINVVDEQEDIAPGDSVDLTANLEPGHYALICNLPDHYEQGMHADFTVNP
jgi:uncharacterized cupredoxin-like copper-binding protein